MNLMIIKKVLKQIRRKNLCTNFLKLVKIIQINVNIKKQKSIQIIKTKKSIKIMDPTWKIPFKNGWKSKKLDKWNLTKKRRTEVRNT